MSQDNIPTGWRRHLWFLRSRKVQVALATVLVAIAGQYGVELGEGTLTTILAVGVAVILGIAIEDAGSKAGAGGTVPQLLTALLGKIKGASGLNGQQN